MAHNRRRWLQAIALGEVTLAVASQRDPQGVCRAAVDRLVEHFDYEYAGIFVREDERLECKAWQGEAGPLPAGDEAFVARTVRLATPQVKLERGKDPGDLVAGGRAGNELCVPILLEGVAIGALVIRTRKVRLFSAVVQDALAFVARHVAVALQNARMSVAAGQERSQLLAVERRRILIAETLNRAIAALSFTQDTGRIVEQVLGALKTVVQCDVASVCFFERGLFRCDPNSTHAGAMDDVGRSLPVADDPVFGSWLQQERQEAELIPNVLQDARWAEVPATAPEYMRGVQCFLGVPLIMDHSIGGALIVGNVQPNSLDELDVSASVAFAERLARALRNAQLYQMERTANARMQAAMQLQDEFVATVSHELRTPLTSILGFSENLIAHWDKLDDGRRRSNVEKIQRAGTRLDRLVRDLLYISRLDSGSLGVSLVRQPMLSLVRLAWEDLAHKYPGQLVGLDASLESAVAVVDGERLRQVLGNLMDNAAKYSPEGSPIEVTWAQGGAWGTISISDHGPGIPAESVPRLFQRFGKLDHVTRSGQIGTGLGLYICRQLVDAMGGRVWYEPLNGGGSSFNVRLPLHSSSAIPG